MHRAIHCVSRVVRGVKRSPRVMVLPAVVFAILAAWAAKSSELGENSVGSIDSVHVYPDGRVQRSRPGGTTSAGVSFLEVTCSFRDNTELLVTRDSVELLVKCTDTPWALDRAVLRTPHTARAVAEALLEKSSVIDGVRSLRARQLLTVEAIDEAIRIGSYSVNASRAAVRWRGVAALLIGFCAVGCAIVATSDLRRRIREEYWKLDGKLRCTTCGYSAEGLRAGTCPECGSVIENTGASVVMRARATLVHWSRDRVVRPLAISGVLVIVSLFSWDASNAIGYADWWRGRDAFALTPWNLVASASGFAGVALLVTAIVHGWRRLKARYRADMGEDVCRECGYSMVEIEHSTCPECGKTF